MEKAKGIVQLFIAAGEKWADDRAARMAAALSYYSLFSVAPLLFILVGIIGSYVEQYLGEDEIQGTVIRLVGNVLPSDIIDSLLGLMRSTAENQTVTSSLPLVSLISGIMVLWGASNMFAYLLEALNRIWGVRPLSRKGLIGTIRRRLLSFTIVFVAGALLVIYMLVFSLLSLLIPVLNDLASRYHLVADLMAGFPDTRLIQILQFFTLFIVATLLFGALYKILPDVEIAWRDVLIGAVVTSLLFGVGTLLLSIYFTFFSTSVYGAAGSLIVLLLWFYYSAQIFFFGAEFTYVYASRYGTRILPSENAIALSSAVMGSKDFEERAGKERKAKGDQAGAQSGFAASINKVIERIPQVFKR